MEQQPLRPLQQGVSVNQFEQPLDELQIEPIYEDEIEDIYDLKIGRYVISDLYTFNRFSNNDKAVEFFHDFLRDERFEKIDDVLYQIAEERFDWFTEQKKGLYGGKVYNIDASLSMSAPVIPPVPCKPKALAVLRSGLNACDC